MYVYPFDILDNTLKATLQLLIYGINQILIIYIFTATTSITSNVLSGKLSLVNLVLSAKL